MVMPAGVLFLLNVGQHPVCIEQKLNCALFAYLHHSQLYSMHAIVLLRVWVALIKCRTELNNSLHRFTFHSTYCHRFGALSPRFGSVFCVFINKTFLFLCF